MNIEKTFFRASLLLVLPFTNCSEFGLPEFEHSPEPELPAYAPMTILEGYGTYAINMRRTRQQIERYAGEPMEETPFSTSYIVKNIAESAYVRIIWDFETETPMSIAFRSGLSIVRYLDSNGIQHRRTGIHYGATKRTVDSAYAGYRKISSDTSMGWAYSGLGISYLFQPDGSINLIIVTEP